MKAGVSMGFDGQGRVIGARLLGPPGKCCRIQTPLPETGPWRFCTREWPHEGDCNFEGTYADE